MPPVAVIFATREGHTHRIADHVAATLRSRGVEAEVFAVGGVDEPFELGRFDAAVLAASVHRGHHEREMVEFVRRHRSALEHMTTAFLSVSLTEVIAEDGSATAEARAQAAAAVAQTLDAFYEATGWRPTHVMAVAGALPYRRYGALVRLLVKTMVKRWGGPTDTSKNYEFTNWAAVKSFADDLARELERR